MDTHLSPQNISSHPGSVNDPVCVLVCVCVWSQSSLLTNYSYFSSKTTSYLFLKNVINMTQRSGFQLKLSWCLRTVHEKINYYFVDLMLWHQNMFLSSSSTSDTSCSWSVELYTSDQVAAKHIHFNLVLSYCVKILFLSVCICCKRENISRGRCQCRKHTPSYRYRTYNFL